MAEKPYSREVIDLKFGEVHDRFDRQDDALSKILVQTTATNGKVKKIIIAIAVIIGVALGSMGKDVLPLIISLVI